MSKTPEKIEKLKELWYSRMPVHENNVDSGEDMFWQTVLCVIDDFNSTYAQSTQQPTEDYIEGRVKGYEKGWQDCANNAAASTQQGGEGEIDPMESLKRAVDTHNNFYGAENQISTPPSTSDGEKVKE